MLIRFCDSGNIREQRGTSLLEAMISMLLIATLGLSLMVVISNALSLQRFSVTESWVLMNMRSLAMSDDDSMSRVNASGQTVTVTALKADVDRDVEITIGDISKTITVTSRQVQVNNTDHVSGDGRLVLAP